MNRREGGYGSGAAAMVEISIIFFVWAAHIGRQYPPQFRSAGNRAFLDRTPILLRWAATH